MLFRSFYLRLAGTDHRVDATEVLALSGIDKFRGFGWIGFVLKGIEPADVRALTSHELDVREGRGVEQAWIENQYEYFTARVARLERSSRRVRRLRYTLFIAILVVISALFAFGEVLHHVDMGLGVPLKNTLTFTMGLLAVLLGVWELHQNKMATRELLWQYRNQLSHFSRARAQLTRVTTRRRRNDAGRSSPRAGCRPSGCETPAATFAATTARGRSPRGTRAPTPPKPRRIRRLARP